MPSPQSSASFVHVQSEDELLLAHDLPSIIGGDNKLLRQFSALGMLHNKLNFLFTCLSNTVIPKGFYLKWSEQTGFSSLDLQTNIKNCLSKTSMQLMKFVFEASVKEFESSVPYICSLQSTVSPKFSSIPTPESIKKYARTGAGFKALFI